MVDTHPGKRLILSPSRLICIVTLTVASLCRPAASVIISPVRQCVDQGGKPVTEGDCQWRSHTNIDVKGGEESVSYVLRRKDNPNSGLYIHIQTSETALNYGLEYVMDVPRMYREHNRSLTYGQMQGQCDNCDAISLDACTTEDDIPPPLKGQFKNKVCCICNVNAHDGSARENFSCSGISSYFMYGKCVSMSCLEAVGPWYSIYKPAYPPDIYRRIFVDVYAFDGDDGVIPDVATKGYHFSENEEERRYLKEPVYKDNHYKFTISANALAFKNEELDIKVTLIKQQWLDGNAPQKLEKYVAVPTWPESDETVQGSSLKYDCEQASREEHICEHGQDAQCRMERCALNVRAIEADAIDTTGTQCDKIGVSMGTWGNEGRLCNTSKNSCIQNQLGWYLDEKGDKARLPKLYGAQPMLAHKRVAPPAKPLASSKAAAPGPKTALKLTISEEEEEDDEDDEDDDDDEISEWHDDTVSHAIAYSVGAADTSRIEIDTFEATVTLIIAEAVGFIVSAKVDGTCAIASDSICRIMIVTKNVGEIRASFSHRIHCYDADGLSQTEVASAAEHSVSVDPNSTASSAIPLNILASGNSDKINCNIDLFSSTVTLLETVTIQVTLSGPVATMGMDVRSYDSITDTSQENHTVKVDDIPVSNQCNCTGFAVACFFGNFKSCMGYAFNKYYTWFVVGISAISVVVLLPVLIPLGSLIINRISASIARSRIAAQQRRQLLAERSTHLSNDV
ncbi:uncharacterized protein BXIN_1235 [Babesia sp. Xinjiang]|uniref:uncharacterized protein n=1 Tax=Babesia sp. Xinjiang TaxID=462227 RepID=UPI000A2354FB|nr:uncharacterized protein BXIN_1235 [Babesia sp. Xinjiang]ORM40151.1 hypothetical protein BXIN_1235 [Babesia sp. Xinjiang]